MSYLYDGENSAQDYAYHEDQQKYSVQYCIPCGVEYGE